MPLRVAVHGGCGIHLRPGVLSGDRDRACRVALSRSLTEAYALLENGGSSVDAVCRAISVLEDAPEFNAGRGAVCDRDGMVTCDAGLMHGQRGVVGAVSTTKTVANPIVAAVEVMRHTPHAILCGIGADLFAKEHRLKIVDQQYFKTDEMSLPPCGHSHHSQGTVGAVALDANGLLVGGSSTGGICGKMPGRVSDSSVAGAGFWADERVALSGTGNGDNFLRTAACRLIADRVAFTDDNLHDASEHVVHHVLNQSAGWSQKFRQVEAPAGVVAVDVSGNVCMPHNTPGMFRGRIGDDNPRPTVFIFDY